MIDITIFLFALCSPEACAAILWKSSQAAPKVHMINTGVPHFMQTEVKTKSFRVSGSRETKNHSYRTMQAQNC